MSDNTVHPASGGSPETCLAFGSKSISAGGARFGPAAFSSEDLEVLAHSLDGAKRTGSGDRVPGVV